MKLEEIKGLRKEAREKLRRSGIRTVEQLALVDPNRKKIQGFTPGQLLKLRKQAQTVIFHNAYQRVRRIADTAIEDIEGRLQEATWATVDAARVAERRAQDALHAARERTRVVARVAVAKAREATRDAEKEYAVIRRRVQKASPKMRRALGEYEERARRAVEAAQRARTSATRALDLANQRWKNEIKLARQRGEGLVARLRENLAQANGGAARLRTPKRTR